MRFLLKGRRENGEIVSFEVDAPEREPPSTAFPYGRARWSAIQEFKDRQLTPISEEMAPEDKAS